MSRVIFSLEALGCVNNVLHVIIVVAVSIDKVSREVVSGPDIVSRGFVYVKESEEFIEELRKIVIDVFEECKDKKTAEYISK